MLLRRLLLLRRRLSETCDMTEDFIGCRIAELPESQWVAASITAAEINPANALPLHRAADADILDILGPQRIALLTQKYFGAGGVDLAVSFLDGGPADLRARILSHMNAWGEWANVRFREVSRDGQVRIVRTPGQGYWSYLGTDVLHIPAGKPTLCLDSFSMQTPESEYRRVVRHETGHTLGCPHEHMRRELVARLDPQRTVAYFAQTQRWSEQTTRQQVLTPLDERSLMTTPADQTSIMCYQLPGSITTDGRPISGGNDVNQSDAAFMAKVYPKAKPPEPPAPPPTEPGVATNVKYIQSLDADGKVLSVYEVVKRNR